jgi:DNA-directed RNA polymerase subunit RPC12/RpoP
MANCAHCEVTIVDPTVQVVHGAATFCCANCAAAVEESGSGSDPRTLSHPDALRCGHCGTAIVDESTMVSRGDQAFCCANCAREMASSANAAEGRLGVR